MADPRPDMVEAARKFMMTPKVRETSYEEQRQFLIGKGVTEEEIDAARSSLPAEALQPATAGGSAMPQYYAPPPPPHNRVLSFAQSVLVVGSVTYAGYRFMRSYVLPRFFDMPDPAAEETRQLQQQVNELQNSMKFVMDSVSQTTSTLALQQEEISKALMSISSRDTDLSRIDNGISTIKSLLLSHNNFAPISAPAVSTLPSMSALPSWQRPVATTTTTAATNGTSGATSTGYSTPPANFKEDGHEPTEGEEVTVNGGEQQRDSPV